MRWYRLLTIPLILGALGATAPLHAQPGASGEDAASADELVTLEFEEIELRKAVQFILRGRSEVRFVTGEPLSEKLTVKLTDIQWRLALESLLKAHEYTIVEEIGGVLRVKKSAKRSPESTRRTPLVFHLKHTDAAALRDFLAPILSKDGQMLLLGSGGSTRVFAVVDLPEVLETVRELLPSIDVPTGTADGEIKVNDDGSIDIELRDYPMAQVASLFANTLHLNVHVSGALGGLANLKLRGVTWEHALALVLKDAGFIFQNSGGVVLINSIADSEGQLVTQQFRLRFIDGWDLKEYLEELLSTDGRIACYSPSPRNGYEFGESITEQRRQRQQSAGPRPETRRSRVISITDRAEIVSSIAERIRELDVKPRQVEVDVKIVQITRDNQLQAGIDWATIASFTGASRPTNLPWGPHSGRFFPAIPDAATGFTFGSLAADQLTAVLRLIAEDDMAEVISEPNITTLDNIEASILIGQRFPVTQETIDPQTAVRTITLDYYEDIGIQLVVVPSISEGDRVQMVIHPVVSTLGDLVDERFPVINTREADTQLLLNSGETAVIGGLIERTENDTERSVPLLGKIPLVGWFFRYRDRSTVTTELVILVTPRIVREPGEIQESLLIGEDRVKGLDQLAPRFRKALGE